MRHAPLPLELAANAALALAPAPAFLAAVPPLGRLPALPHRGLRCSQMDRPAATAAHLGQIFA